jgi:hypothetical protein
MGTTNMAHTARENTEMDVSGFVYLNIKKNKATKQGKLTKLQISYIFTELPINLRSKNT